MDRLGEVEKVLENTGALLGFCDLQTCSENAECHPIMATSVAPPISPSVRGPARWLRIHTTLIRGLAYHFISKPPWGGGHTYFPWFTMAATELDMLLPPHTYQGYLPNKYNNIMNSVTYLGVIFFPSQKSWRWIFSLVSVHPASVLGNFSLWERSVASERLIGKLTRSLQALLVFFLQYFTTHTCAPGLTWVVLPLEHVLSCLHRAWIRIFTLRRKKPHYGAQESGVSMSSPSHRPGKSVSVQGTTLQGEGMPTQKWGDDTGKGRDPAKHVSHPHGTQ